MLVGEVHLDPTLLTWGGLVAVLVFSWAYRAADGRRHDFTFLNQGTFFLKWGTFFLLFTTKIKVVHTQGGTQNTNRHTPQIIKFYYKYYSYT